MGGSKTLNVARSESDLEELAPRAARSPFTCRRERRRQRTLQPSVFSRLSCALASETCRPWPKFHSLTAVCARLHELLTQISCRIYHLTISLHIASKTKAREYLGGIGENAVLLILYATEKPLLALQPHKVQRDRFGTKKRVG